MAYCEFTDIQEDFKSTAFTSTSLVTENAVTQFIDEADALINAYVGTRYVVPLTGDCSTLDLMKLFSRTLVSDRVRGILENKQNTNVDGNQNVKARSFSTADVMRELTKIKDAALPLSGADLTLAGGAFFSNNHERGAQPVFQKNRKQW